MTVPVEGAPGTDDVDRRRLRRMRRTLGWGVATATVLAAMTGIGGGSGALGAAVWLLVTSATCAVAALYGVATALVDDLRDDPVSRARIGWTVGLFFLAAALMAMVAGLGG